MVNSGRKINVAEALEEKIRLVLNSQAPKVLKSLLCNQIYVGTFFFLQRSPKSVGF